MHLVFIEIISKQCLLFVLNLVFPMVFLLQVSSASDPLLAQLFISDDEIIIIRTHSSTSLHISLINGNMNIKSYFEVAFCTQILFVYL